MALKILTVYIETEIFRAIVSMCSKRIQQRLRLVDDRYSKDPVQMMLQEYLKLIPHKPESTEFITSARNLSAAINEWENHRVPLRLCTIVQAVHDLSQIDIPNITTVARASSSGVDPSRIKSLFNIIQKVARYRGAARVLYRTAKGFPIARRINIVPISLPQKAFQPIAPSDSGDNTLASKISSLKMNRQYQSTSYICQLLKHNEASANGAFRSLRDDAISRSKIHAEIQLIYHLETNPSNGIAPRVICSNKSACFLCNAFMAMHGKFHTPKSHGRIYAKWRLPSLPIAHGHRRQSILLLETTIRESIRTLFRRRQKTVYAYPNESSILTIAWSRSTMTLSSVGPPSAEVPPSAEPISLNLTDSPLNEKTSEELNKGTVENKEISEITNNQPAAGADGTIASPTISAELQLLPRGYEQISRIDPNKLSPEYRLGSLNLQLEYSVGPNYKPQASTSLTCTIEWLSDAVQTAVMQAGDAKIVDVDEMSAYLDLDASDLGRLYLLARGTLVRVCIE